MTRQEGTLSTADVANAEARTDTPSAERRPTEALAKRTALFPERDAADFRKRWIDTQTAFVDEPRSQWDRGDNVTTEDRRVALQRYRSFFDRLLTM